MTSSLISYVKSWIEKANNDIISAERLLDIEPVILDNACFHCQQAIEKYLKAYLIYNGVEIEKTHSITFLLSQCAKFDHIFSTIDSLNINAYAVRGRYPDSALAPEIEEAQQYYQLTLQVRNLVLERLSLNN
jgi:HEPN domain-containing protein